MQSPPRFAATAAVSLFALAAPSVCRAQAPMDFFEASGRGHLTLVQDPPAFGQDVHFPLFFPSGAAFLHAENQTATPIVIRAGQAVHFADEMAQDGVLFSRAPLGRSASYYRLHRCYIRPRVMQVALDHVVAHSHLFGPARLYGPTTTDTLDALLAAVDKKAPAATALRSHLLATWLALASGDLPANTLIRADAVKNGARVFGAGARALHVPFVEVAGYGNAQGGVLGAIEHLLLAGAPSADLLVAKAVLEAIGANDARVLTGDAVIEGSLRQELYIAEQARQSVYADRLGLPQPPGYALPWACTEGQNIGQFVDAADFGIGGELLPEPIPSIVSARQTGLVLTWFPLIPVRIGEDLVRIEHRLSSATIRFSYFAGETSEAQFRRFVSGLAAQAGLTLETAELDHPFFGRQIVAILRSDQPFLVENLESTPSGPWLFSLRPQQEPLVLPSQGQVLQHRVWIHLDQNPMVVIGKTPLYATGAERTVRLQAKNLGRPATGAILVEDRVPAGLVARDFSIQPTSEIAERGGARLLRWQLAPLGGSSPEGVHPAHAIHYTLAGAVRARTVVGGATATWNGKTSRSADVVLEP